MKNKNIIGMIAFLMLIIIPCSIDTEAILMPDQVAISQSPSLDSVTSVDIVKVTVTITVSLIDDHELLSSAELRYTIDEIAQPTLIYELEEPKLISPSLTLTFYLGPFEKGSEIEYTIYLECLLSRFDFESEVYAYKVSSTAEESTNLWLYVAIPIIVVIALTTIIVVKKNK